MYLIYTPVLRAMLPRSHNKYLISRDIIKSRISLSNHAGYNRYFLNQFAGEEGYA